MPSKASASASAQGRTSASEEAEKYIPRNTCALIKGFMGFKLAGLCPYIETADLIVGETTCDGKKKAYEIFDEITKKVYVMELPNKKSEDGKLLWTNEIRKFARKLSEKTGKEITLDKLREAAGIVNAKRRALQRLSALRSNDPAPISGLDALLINQISFYDDPIRFTTKLNELCDELDQRLKEGSGAAPKGTEEASRVRIAYGYPQLETRLPYRDERGHRGGRGVLHRRAQFHYAPRGSSVDEAIQKIADRSMGINCAMLYAERRKAHRHKEPLVEAPCPGCRNWFR